MQYKRPKDLLESVPRHVKAYIYKLLVDACANGKDFYVDSRPEIVRGNYSATNDTRNIGATLNSAFSPGVVPSDFPYPTSTERTARYTAPITRISGPDFVIHFGKTNDPLSLPPPAKYRKQWSHRNDFPEQHCQMKIFEDPPGTVQVGLSPYSLIVTYGLDAEKKLTHARLVVPSSDFQSILDREDLTAYKGYRIVVDQKHAPAKRVVTPKREKKERRVDGEDRTG